MARSKFAISVLERVRETGKMAASVDTELQEVREVLASLSLLRSDGSRCFCEDGLYNQQHQNNCLRARALWAKLQIG